MSIRKNTIYNVVGALAPLGITLITLPIYIDLIGEERFGVLAIAWVMLGYFGLFDLGLGRATAQRIATLKNAKSKERSETFWTALLLNMGFGCIGGLLLWPVASLFFSDYFQVSEQLRPEIISALPWLIISLPVATLSGVLTGALQGREQFLTLNIINVVGNVFFQLFPLFIAWKYGPELTLLLPTVILSRLLTFSLLFKYCRRYIPLVGSPIFIRALISPLFKFGGWITVTSIIGPLMVVFDRFIIGTLSGAKMVTYYTVPYSLAERVSIIPGSLASALFPRFAAVSPKEQEQLTQDSVKALAVILTPLIIIGLFIMHPFLAWWLTPEFAEKTGFVGQIFLLGFWVNSFARVPLARLQAKGRPDLVAKCHMAELFPYVILMYFLISEWDIVGAAIAWSLRVTIDCILLFIFSSISVKTWKLLFIPAFLLCIAAAVVFIPLFSNLTLMLPIGIFCVSLFWSWCNIPASLRIVIYNINYISKYLNRVVWIFTLGLLGVGTYLSYCDTDSVLNEYIYKLKNMYTGKDIKI